MFSLIYCLNGNLIKFSHTSQIHFSTMNLQENLIVNSRQQKPPKLSLSHGQTGPHLTHPSLARPLSPPQLTA